MNSIHWLFIGDDIRDSSITELQKVLKPEAPVIAISTFPCVKPIEKITDPETDPTAFWSLVQKELSGHYSFDRNCETLSAYRNNNGRRGMMESLTGNTAISNVSAEKYAITATLENTVNRISSLQPYQHIAVDNIRETCARHLRYCNPDTRWIATAQIGRMPNREPSAQIESAYPLALLQQHSER